MGKTIALVFPNKLRGTTRFEALGNISGLYRSFGGEMTDNGR